MILMIIQILDISKFNTKEVIRRMRLAEIAPDPVNPSNNTLQFWIKEPNSGNNGRIQGNLYGNNGIYNLHYSVRLFLPGDFNILKNAPFDFRFMTLMEFWNNANWTDEDYMFRIKSEPEQS